MKSKLLQKIIDYGLVSILIVFPLSINLALISKNDLIHPLFTINISMADILIGIILILWLIILFVEKGWRNIKLPPNPVIFFIGIGILSFANAFSKSEWLKEIIQLIEYFLLLFILIINNIKTVKPEAIKNTIYVSATTVLLFAFFQHVFLKGDAYLTRGFFLNNIVMGVFLCIAVPFIYFELMQSRSIVRKSWMIVLLLLSVIVITSGSALLSITISLLVVNWIYSKKIFYRLLIVAVVIGILYSFVLPLKNVDQIRDFSTVYERGSISENYYRRLTMLGYAGRNTLFRKDFSEKYLQITMDDFFNVKLPKPDKGERYKEMEAEKHFKNLFLEMQAGLNLISENTLLGLGLGNYQNQIGSYFKELPKVNTAKPNQNNTYLIVASTTGILGLTFFIFILFSLIKNQLKNIRTGNKDTLTLSILGGLIAVSVEGLFSMLLNVSLMVPLVFLFYLAYTNLETAK